LREFLPTFTLALPLLSVTFSIKKYRYKNNDWLKKIAKPERETLFWKVARDSRFSPGKMTLFPVEGPSLLSASISLLSALGSFPFLP
jgi:hypothetical protein